MNVTYKVKTNKISKGKKSSGNSPLALKIHYFFLKLYLAQRYQIISDNTPFSLKKIVLL